MSTKTPWVVAPLTFDEIRDLPIEVINELSRNARKLYFSKSLVSTVLRGKHYVKL